MSARLIDRMDPEYRSSPYSCDDAAEKALARLIGKLRARGTNVTEIPPRSGERHKSYEFFEGNTRKVVTIQRI